MYAHLRFTLGLPIVPEGEGALPLFWVHGVLHGILPASVARALWPVSMAAVLVTEAVNVAIKLATQSPFVQANFLVSIAIVCATRACGTSISRACFKSSSRS